MNIRNNLEKVSRELNSSGCKLIAVSKTHPPEVVKEAYDAGQKDFGENKVQELLSKKEYLPEDIKWHLIGHLQSNKVKYIAPFIHLIHSIDSLKLLKEVNKEALKNNRIIDCLIQIHVAEEESKFGMNFQECEQILSSPDVERLQNVRIKGLMGMATFTDDCDQVRSEFRSLRQLFEGLKQKTYPSNIALEELSMGMSGDYQIAAEEGSTLVRVGSLIFGERD